MNKYNDELKKKIISALQSVEFITEKGWCGQCISLRLDYSAIADALIAAGLTFDGEWKHKFEVAQKKLEKWQNIYFLALKNAIKFYGIELCPIECPFQYNFCGSDDCINLLAENFMQQAEKELAEEKKSD